MVYRKDSFDRFGDDLCQLLLSYLPISHSIRYECVSNQWKLLLFNKQRVLNLTLMSNNIYDNIEQIFYKNSNFNDFNIKIRQKQLKTVLKKCRFINQIKIQSNCLIDSKIFEIIRDNCYDLKVFICFANINNLSQEVLNSFGQKFSHSLKHFVIHNIGFEKMNKLLISTTFSKLEKLEFNYDFEGNILKNINKELMPKLSEIKFPFNSFDGLKSLTDNYWQTIKKIDIILDTENELLVNDGINRALITLSELKNMEEFDIRIYTEKTFVSAIDNGLRLIANSCKKLKRLDFLMDCIVIKGKLFEIFSQFKELEYCEISIEFNEEMTDYGTIASFANCKNLKVLNLYLYNLCDYYFEDIHKSIPKLTQFHFKSKNGITDKTLTYLKECPNLKILEVHTYDDWKTVLNISDSTVCDFIRNSPKIRIIMFFSKTNTITTHSIEEFIAKANKCPKRMHRFLSYFQLSNQKDIELPNNLFVLKLPQRITINRI